MKRIKLDIKTSHPIDIMNAFQYAVEVGDKRYLLKKYRNVFVGSNAVTTIKRIFFLPTRADALTLGNLFMDRGLFEHVSQEHDLLDNERFYRFIKGGPLTDPRPFDFTPTKISFGMMGMLGGLATQTDDFIKKEIEANNKKKEILSKAVSMYNSWALDEADKKKLIKEQLTKEELLMLSSKRLEKMLAGYSKKSRDEVLLQIGYLKDPSSRPKRKHRLTVKQSFQRSVGTRKSSDAEMKETKRKNLVTKRRRHKQSTVRVDLKKSHEQHYGELEVQKRRGVPATRTKEFEQLLKVEIEAHNISFFTNLEYFAISTTDGRGYPCPTIFCAPKIQIKGRKIKIIASFSEDDLFVDAINSSKKLPCPFAAIALEFAKRQRSTLSGHIIKFKKNLESNGDRWIYLELLTNEYMQHCPKYITVRKVKKKKRASKTKIARGSNIITDECRSHLDRASSMYLGTKHTEHSNIAEKSDMGLNHRGGLPGFIRSYTKAGTSYLVIPDYKGNRAFQNLGNIQSDRVAGIIVPDFKSGDCLFCVGVAENKFDEDAQEIMPSVTLLTKITIKKMVLIGGMLDLELTGEEKFSPYNPPLSFLESELKGQNISLFAGKKIPLVTLVNISIDSTAISTYTFSSKEKLSFPIGGGHGIFDFSKVLEDQLEVKKSTNPKYLNDTLVRTWTISSLSNALMAKNQFAITVKLDGFVSTYLHGLRLEKEKTGKVPNLQVPLLGLGGDFTCFDDDNKLPKKMIWFAAGVGITPFMRMYEEIVEAGMTAETDVMMYFSCRGDELEVVKKWEKSKMKMKVKIFDSTGAAKDDTLEIVNGRVSTNSITSIEDLKERVVYICGPKRYMSFIVDSCKSGGQNDIHFESFSY